MAQVVTEDPSSEIQCPSCGLSNTSVDRIRNLLLCLSCGGLTELGNLRAEAEFEELNTGRHVAVGTRLREDQRIVSGMKDNFAATRPSTEMTLYNAKKVVESVARPLGLQREVDIAHNFYKIALQNCLTRGHKVKYMAAGCLYIAARLRQTHHMLLDFCDVVDINITNLTKIYMKLLMVLCITLPPVDPSVYIPRFVQKLKLENTDKANVSAAALRICQRMKRDYMVIGRRASGLCGASILLASRIYGYEVPLNRIAKIVKISQTVLRNRVREFEETEAASLSVNEFLEMEDGSKKDIEINASDPPSFTRGKAFDKFLNDKLEEMNQFTKFDDHILKISQEIDSAMEKLEKSSKERVLEEETLKKYNEDFTGYTSDDPDFEEAKQYLSADHLKMFNLDKDSEQKEELPVVAETADETGEFVEVEPIIGSTLDELDLEGIDDDEIDNYILNKPEAKEKAKVWLKTNVHWLRKQRVKRLEKAEDEAAQLLDPHYKKKRAKRKTNKSELERLALAKAKLSFIEELTLSLQPKKDDVGAVQEADVIEEIMEIEEEPAELSTGQDETVNVHHSPAVNYSPVHSPQEEIAEPQEDEAAEDIIDDESSEEGDDPFSFL